MDETDALLAGRFHDPHQLLGPHMSGSHAVIRAFKPGADEVIARTATAQIALERRDGDLFECVLEDSTIPTYTLEIGYPDGTRNIERDPYSFAPTIGELDLHLFGEGRHENLTHVLGARPYTFDDVSGTAFSVWAPSALSVTLVGDFNAWHATSHPMRSLGSSGIWELFLPDVTSGMLYKFIVLGHDGMRKVKADPLALATETPPRTASKVWDSRYQWSDHAWLENSPNRRPWQEPISIYEVHLGSWRQGLNYIELANQIADYVNDLGFTHIEIMPVMEHPFSGSWGYQVTGFYAPTARFGSPDEFKNFVDILHERGIGVILDWVPAHFPRDDWALARFDGTALYEHEDEKRGAHPDWGTLVFNHGRNEVRNFLISNARHWLEEFHADALRVDAVASMLYLDYSRRPGEWIPNRMGGREDLEALEFLQELNTIVYRDHPGVMMIAEESTAWPGVTHPVSQGGLGFGFKWNLGWMHDTLEYFSRDPIHRSHHHNELTFASIYAYSENYVLPLSHDEVVHGKGSLLAKMPGDRWQQFANLRALFGFMWAHPGKKLLFMGGEFAQEHEWDHDRSLDWHLLAGAGHAGVANLVRDLNQIYRNEPALWELDTHPDGFDWISAGDADHNIIAFVRRNFGDDRELVCVSNLSPVPRDSYRIGMPHPGTWKEILNTDASYYGGSNIGNGGAIETSPAPFNGFDNSAEVTLPPLATLWFTSETARES